MRILVAPDSFKDALSATAVCAAIARGAAADQDITLDLCPLGDGGEGTGALLGKALCCDLVTEEVQDPLGRTHTATWYHHPTDDRAVIEMAEATGLMLLASDERNPLRTSSYGTGQLLAAAFRRGCKHVQVCVGGSATVDGGVGCLQALGWTFWDRQEQIIPEALTGGDLAKLGGLAAPLEIPEAKVEVLCDVDNPLLGPRGAAAVYGPQKGATEEMVPQLEAGLRHYATLLSVMTGFDVTTYRGAGAGGGIPSSLYAALEAAPRVGFEAVSEAVNLRKRIARADCVITGEGCLDAQTLDGKVVGRVAAHAADIGRPVLVVVGWQREALDLSVAGVSVLSPEGPTEAARQATEERLIALTPQLLAQARSLS